MFADVYVGTTGVCQPARHVTGHTNLSQMRHRWGTRCIRYGDVSDTELYQIQSELPWNDLGVHTLGCMQPWVLGRCSGCLFVPFWSTSSCTRAPRVFHFIPPSDQNYRYWDALVPLATAPKATNRWRKMYVTQRELLFRITVQPPVQSPVS